MANPCITVWRCDHGVEEWFGVGVPARGEYSEIFKFNHDGKMDEDEFEEYMSSNDADCGSLEMAEIPVEDIKEEFLEG